MRASADHPLLVEGYRVGELIGRRVWEATSEETDDNNLYTVKLFPFTKSSDQSSFAAELNIWEELIHPNILPVVEILEFSKKGVIVSPRMETNLSEFIEKFPNGLPESIIQCLFQQICTVVKYCHEKNIAHLHIHPNHLLLQGKRKHMIVKLTDFGSARRYTSDTLLRTETVGADFYRSPEMEARKPLSPPAADMWSLGILLHVMLTGHVPYLGFSYDELYANAKQVKLEIDSGLDEKHVDILLKMLQKHPTSRCTIDEILADPWFELDFTSKTLSQKYPSSVFIDPIMVSEGSRCVPKQPAKRLKRMLKRMMSSPSLS